MKFRHLSLRTIIVLSSIVASGYTTASQVLVTIDDKNVTMANLETALASSPFYTQFNTLDENEQAAIRGDMLKRLVTARLLETEAKQLRLETTPEFRDDMESYLAGVRYQKYLQRLRQSIRLSEEELRDLRQDYATSSDAYVAARSSIISRRYQALLQLTLQKLRDQYHARLYTERITPQLKADTVLLQSDNLQLTYADLMDDRHEAFDESLILEKLFQRTEFILITKAALEEDIDLSDAEDRYIEQSLPTALIEQKIQQWVPDDKVIQDYFRSHPELHKLKDRWHIAQLVVETKPKAETLRKQIIEGQSSLFQLAEQYSIDPNARFNYGDLGWVIQGSGLPAIEAAIADLKVNEISPVIKTGFGYHVVTVLDKRVGATQSYYQIKDKLKQMIINDKMKAYLVELQDKHTVDWLVLETDQKKARALLDIKVETDSE